MASNLLVYCCLFAVVAVWVTAEEDKLDAINVDEVLANDRLVHSYLECVMGDNESKCTKEGRELKSRLPGLVKTGCSDCTPKQLDRAVKTLKHITEKHPKEWKELKAKYDPTGEYTQKFAETWKQRGVNF
uniref:Chemosensory protein 6 n=1 Tax=Oedaleus infernalis TaxID=267432 RepID=A0A3G2LGK9_9ORTH|nr:chemosensory protein 6 [Oedaleus infernalis]